MSVEEVKAGINQMAEKMEEMQGALAGALVLRDEARGILAAAVTGSEHELTQTALATLGVLGVKVEEAQALGLKVVEGSQTYSATL